MHAIGEALLHDWPGMLGISVAILALFGAGEVLRRTVDLPTEYTRKLAHLGSGVVVFAFPWVLSSAWSVLVLALSFFGILVGGRVTGLLGSVHSVDRQTSGAYLYPFAVYGTWILADGDALRFCVPMAVMAVADTGAAIVGKRAGENKFRVMDGVRSLEGSFTFFALAFGIFLVGLAVDGRGGWPGVLLIALIGGVITTCVEAISVRGVDNLFIPWAGFLVLDRTLRLGLPEMGTWIVGMIIGFAGVIVAWDPAGLRPAGAVAAFLFATLAWAMGGPPWFAPLAALGVMLALVHPRDRDTDLEQIFPAAVGSIVLLIAFAHTGTSDLYLPFLVTVAANGAIALARAGRSWAPLAGLVGALVPGLAARVVSTDVPVPVVCIGGLCGLVAYAVLRGASFPGRRLVASGAAGLVTWLVFS